MGVDRAAGGQQSVRLCRLQSRWKWEREWESGVWGAEGRTGHVLSPGLQHHCPPGEGH